MANTNTDKIEKRTTLKAPRSRVWRALSNAQAFGTWFGVKLESEFKEGAVVRGKLTIPDYEHLTLEMRIERVTPESVFSYRWHPYALDASVDYSKEPMTLVEFTLAEAKDGTLLTVTESGFDKIPVARRAEAFRMNEGGWAEQLENIERHVRT